MFRDLARKKRQILIEECIDLLKKEPRGVLSVLGDDEYIKEEIRMYAHETLLLQLTPEHVCGKLVKES